LGTERNESGVFRPRVQESLEYGTVITVLCSTGARYDTDSAKMWFVQMQVKTTATPGPYE